jgi:DNA invertase Pin-like site-specific DNA recombinase
LQGRSARRRLRCAIYTRKSSDEGLEQDFNSLHAQREACEAYILSQRHEGWQVLSAEYDDGGFSGGSLERPALQRLLADIALGKVDVVVVYKVDRLTRSLADFAKIVEVFDGKGASFVSVTQQFNTTSSMGRLTLNVLLSFAQFEREVTGERIRDKIAASKAKGMWMGGWVPIGYDRKDRTLVINETDAETIRTIFREYLRLGNIRLLQAEIRRLGLMTKNYEATTGRKNGGRPFTRGHLHAILTNPIYIGEIAHKGRRHAGMHAPIIDRETWDAVQSALMSKGDKGRGGTKGKSRSLLAGFLFNAAGRRLTPTHSTRRGHRHDYYVESSPEEGAKPLRLPAAPLETALIRLVSSFLADEAKLVTEFREVVGARDMKSIFERAGDLADELQERAMARSFLQESKARVEASDRSLKVTLDQESLLRLFGIERHPSDMQSGGQIVLEDGFQLERRGVAVRLALGDDGGQTEPDPSLLKALARGHVWFDDLLSGRAVSITEIARREGVTDRYVSQILDLAFLAPSLVAAALQGTQAAGVNAKRLSLDLELPLLWSEQQRVLGVS